MYFLEIVVKDVHCHLLESGWPQDPAYNQEIITLKGRLEVSFSLGKHLTKLCNLLTIEADGGMEIDLRRFLKRKFE